MTSEEKADHRRRLVLKPVSDARLKIESLCKGLSHAAKSDKKVDIKCLILSLERCAEKLSKAEYHIKSLTRNN